MNNSKAYGIIVDPDPPRGQASVHEFDAVLCSHCERVVEIRPGTDVHRCSCCDALVCKQCVGKGCDHIEKKLARWEARDRLLTAMRG